MSTYWPEDYGVFVGDGITDCGPAMQAAIEAASRDDSPPTLVVCGRRDQSGPNVYPIETLVDVRGGDDDEDQYG